MRGWRVLGVACLAAVSAGGCAGSERPRSVIVITMDTTRADHLGPYGYSSARTPTLDGLAERGTVYERAYATAPETLPSHASIFTGLYPPSHDVRLNLNYRLPDDATTLAEVLRGRGWKTFAVCASTVLDARFGLDQGFDVYDGPDIAVAGDGDGEEEWRAEQVTAKALAHMRGREEAPFFLWVHYYDPHSPYAPPAPFSAPTGAVPESPELYDLEIANMDYWMGALLDGLDERGALKDTLIVVVGDHGESLGEHGETYHTLFIYDATIHVPLIVAGPGVPEGRRVAETVSTVDLFSTILAFLNVEPPPTSSHRLPGLAVGTAAADEQRAVYSESMSPSVRFGWGALESVRTENWLYIRAPKPELYRLDGSDAGQIANLISEHKETAHELDSLLSEMMAAMPLPEHEHRADRIVTEKEERALAALGYAAPGGEAARHASAADPKDLVEVAEAFELALLAGRTGKPRVAVDLLGWAVKADPENFTLLVEYGRALYRTRQYVDASDAFSKARGLGNPAWQVFVDAAAADEGLGRTAPAEAAMDQALQRSPRPADAWNRMGRLRIQRGAWDDAKLAYRKVLELDPGDLVAPRALDWLASYNPAGAGGTGHHR